MLGMAALRLSSPLVFSTFISIPQHLPTLFNLSNIPCSTASSLASITSSSVYLTVRINCPRKSKFSDNLRSSLIMYSLYNWNTIGQKHDPTLTHVSIFTLPAFLWSSLILTLINIQLADQHNFALVHTTSLTPDCLHKMEYRFRV